MVGLDRREALDRAISDFADTPSRSGFVHRLITQALTAKGYLAD